MMKNITLAIDDDLLDKSRAYADRKGTTVNAMVRELLTSVVSQEDRRAAARRGLKELMENSTARMGAEYTWNREDIYEERMLPRHKHPDLRGFSEE